MAENRGDVAFTKVIFVNKYFGLSANTTAQGNPDDFEYLCEDGSRKSLRGRACSWAARPWQGYMGNGDINARATALQGVLPDLYDAAKNTADKEPKKKMLVDEKNLVVNKDKHVLPGSHLELSRYLDVIERSTTRVDAIKLCVDTMPALDKCNVMKMAAFSRDVRPIFECHLKSKQECINQVGTGEMDTVVLTAMDIPEGKRHQLTPVLYEQFCDEDKMVALAPKNTDSTLLHKATTEFDFNNPRAKDAALLFAHRKGEKPCTTGLKSTENGIVKIVHVNIAKNYPDMDLVCQDFTQKPQSEYKNCHFDFAVPRAVSYTKKQWNVSFSNCFSSFFSRPFQVVIKQTADSTKRDDIIHAFTSISEQFGHNSPKEDVFELFGEFSAGQSNVIFDDRAEKMIGIGNEIPRDEINLYLSLHCVSQ